MICHDVNIVWDFSEKHRFHYWPWIHSMLRVASGCITWVGNMPSTPGTSLTTAWWHLGEAMGRFSQDKHIAKTQSLKLWSSFIVFFLRKAFGRFKKMRCSCSCFKDTNLFVPKEKTHYIFTWLETLHPIPPWNASPFFVRPFDTHAHTHTQRSLAGRTFWCPWPTLGVVACGWPRGIERRARAVPLSKVYFVAVQILSNTFQNDFSRQSFHNPQHENRITYKNTESVIGKSYQPLSWGCFKAWDSTSTEHNWATKTSKNPIHSTDQQGFPPLWGLLPALVPTPAGRTQHSRC